MKRRTRTISSEKIQGEGSFVVVSSLTVGDIRNIRARSEDSDSYVENIKMVMSHVEEWNWADAEGNPLPSPQKVLRNQNLLDSMTDEEMDFLSEAVTGKVETTDLKN